MGVLKPQPDVYWVEMNGMLDREGEGTEDSAIRWAKEIAIRHPHAVIRVIREVTQHEEVWTNV